MEKTITINPVYLELLDCEVSRQIVFGGSSSGKSVALAQRAILDILDPSKERNYLIVRNVASTIGKSTFNELCKVINDLDINAYFKINQTNMTITARTGYQILTCGLDDPQKVKSITPAKGTLTDIWIEEATEIEYKSYKELTKRLRGISKGNKRMTLSFNPILKSSWIYTEFFQDWEDDKKRFRSDDILILKTTYKDNMFLTEEDIYLLENEKDEYYKNVYTYGNWGVLGAVIFKNWTVQDCTEIKKIADNHKNGCDFGFASDPATIARLHYDKKRKIIYILAELYQCGLTNDLLAKEMKRIVGQEYITCDSADPRSIQELKNLGINAKGAKKGKGSVNFGIQWLQQQEIIIDIHCQNTKNEFQQYKWQEDKNGNVLPIPVDKNNHLIDAIRYATEDEYKDKQSVITVR